MRPEKIQIASQNALVPAACAHAKGIVTAISYQGAVTRVTVATEKLALIASTPAGTNVRKGDSVSLIWPKSAMVAMGEGA